MTKQATKPTTTVKTRTNEKDARELQRQLADRKRLKVTKPNRSAVTK